MNNLESTFIAHRGLHSDDSRIPENSLLAFKNAIDHNLAIELDIHMLKDGTIVVFHDKNLLRMTGINKKVRDCSLEDILKVKLLNSNEGIPTLLEVLKLVNGRVPLLIELKNNFRYKDVKYLINKLKEYNGEYLLQSFNPIYVFYIKKYDSSIKRGQQASSFKHERLPIILKFILKHMLLNFITKPHFISYNIDDLNKKIVVKQKKKNRQMFGWTIKTKEQYDKALKYCDKIIFEDTLLNKYK